MEDYGSKNRYDFKLWKTNDACDLFRCLIDGLHAELNVAPNPGGNVPVQSNQTNLEHVRKAVVENYLSTDNSIFTNEILTSSSLQTRCKNKNCNCITYNYQFFNITDFFMNDTKYTKAQKLSINPEQVRELNIKDCVKDYEKVSLLPESMCSICRNSGTSQMSKLDIVGRNWVVCLDYGKNKELYTGGFKLDENIDLRKIFKQTANKNGKYYLSGIVIHIGSGQELGHYITYCRMGNEDNTPWYKYDDGAKASKTDFKTIADSLLYSNHFAPRMLVYTAVPDVKGQVNANQSQPQQQILNNIKEQKFNKIKNEVEQKYNVNRVDNTKGLLNPKSKSCYINSVLQCLIHIKPLTTKLLADRIQQKLNPLDNDAKNLINSENEKAKNTIIQRQVSEKLVLRAYTDLLTDVYSRTGNTYSDPTTLINLLNRVNNIYDLNNAGDAYDVLTQFLPIIENETLVKNTQNLINDIKAKLN